MNLTKENLTINIRVKVHKKTRGCTFEESVVLKNIEKTNQLFLYYTGHNNEENCAILTDEVGEGGDFFDYSDFTLFDVSIKNNVTFEKEDLCVFYDDDEDNAVIRKFDCINSDGTFKDFLGTSWKNCKKIKNIEFH